MHTTLEGRDDDIVPVRNCAIDTLRRNVKEEIIFGTARDVPLLHSGKSAYRHIVVGISESGVLASWMVIGSKPLKEWHPGSGAMQSL
jgi:hypothetical protein